MSLVARRCRLKRLGYYNYSKSRNSPHGESGGVDAPLLMRQSKEDKVDKPIMLTRRGNIAFVVSIFLVMLFVGSIE